MDSGDKEKTQKDFDNNIVTQLKTILDSDLSNISEIEIHRADNGNTKANGDSNENTDDNKFGLRELKLIISEYETLRDTYLSLQKQVEVKFQENESSLKFIEEQKLQIKTLQESNKSLLDQIETLNLNVKKESNSRDDLEAAFQKTIDRLEEEIKNQKALTHETNEKLSAHDVAAKRAIMVLQKEMGAKVEQVTKLHQDTMKEKDANLIKISKLEALGDELRQNNATQNKKILEQQMELDKTKTLLKSKTEEIKSIFTNSESHEKEYVKLQKKIETLQEEIKGQETKVTWAQNKLTAELEAHKETKKLVAQYQSKIKQAKEEGDMIRKDCQQMIERYQGDEEISSVRLNKELQECQTKLHRQLEESAKQEEINKEQELAISIIKEDNSKLADDLSDHKNHLFVMGEKSKTLALQLEEKTKDYAEMQTQLDEMKDRVATFEDANSKIIEYETTIKGLEMVQSTMKQQLHDAELEVKEQAEKHHEILQYSQSLTENNASSKASAAELQAKLDALLLEKEKTTDHFQKSRSETQTSIEKLSEEKKQLEEKLDVANKSNKEKESKVEEVQQTLEEARDELKVLKKKNAALVKDLQKQLQQTTKKIEKMESANNGSNENLSNRSRTSSCNSLERIQPESPPNASPLTHEGVLIPQDHYISQPSRQPPLSQHQKQLQQEQFPEVEIDKKVLIERICKLQRVLARKNEKLEFMEEHINQLTLDIQRKTKIIQSFVLKQESGSITPDRYDRIKAEVSQHGGIMASVYSAKSTDKSMTLDLSLTINRKLQAVLEDTILKNITLKENINTLGDEVAKLSTELETKQNKT